MRAPAYMTISTIAVVLTCLSYQAGVGQVRPAIVNEQSDRVGVFPKPTQTDGNLIRTIATVGASQNVAFPAGWDVARFIAEKCGRPSVTLLVHPVYAEVLLGRNPGLSTSDLRSLPEARTLDIPACAIFAEAPEIVATPHTVEEFAARRSVPFDPVIFAKVVTDRQLRTVLQRKYSSTQVLGDSEVFREMSSTLCKAVLKPEDVANLPKSFSCTNAVEIAAANPNIKDPGIIPSEIVFPKVAVPITTKEVLERVPLKGGSAAITNTGSITGLRTTEGPVRFVTEVKNAKEYGPECANAAEIRRGSWPFNVGEFLRALSFTDIMGRPETTRLLVVDSGFDFSDGDKIARQAQRAFPPRYFHRLDVALDPNVNRDANEDTVRGNGGWAGVNLTGPGGGLSAATSILYGHRSHGLSVVTLALGGKELEHLRWIAPFPIRIGIANLVPQDTLNPLMSSGHIERAVKFASASGNAFDVINLSLSSSEEITGLEDIVKARGRGKVIVIAAGNDSQAITSTTGVWPAALGGKARSKDNGEGAYITVGAHDGNGELAKFSNWGPSVDILAPGCMVPSYELDIDERGTALGPSPGFVTGTSFAAPVVSFLASLLATDPRFAGRPGLIKTRILVSSDFNSNLLSKSFASGIVNIPKTLGYQYDVVELDDGRGGRRVKFGILSNKTKLGEFHCSSGESFAFETIKKISLDRRSNLLLVFVNSDDTRADNLERRFCDRAELDNIEYEFEDIEDGKQSKIKASDVLDYIRQL